MALGGSGEDAVLRVSVDTTQAEQGLRGFIASAEQAFTRIVEGNKKLMEFLATGDRASDVFEGLTTNITQADRALQGTVSRLDLAIQANRATAAGLQLTGEQFAAVSVLAKQYADRTGVDATQAMEQLTGAIIRGNERGLKPFGLTAGTTAEILGQVTEKADGVALSFDGVTDQTDRLKSAWSNLTTEVARMADDNGPLAKVIGLLADGLGALSQWPAGINSLSSAFMALAGPITAAANAWANFEAIRDPEGAGRRAAGHLFAANVTARVGAQNAAILSRVPLPQGMEAPGREFLAGGPGGGRGGGGGGAGGGGTGEDFAADLEADMLARSRAMREQAVQADVAAAAGSSDAWLDSYAAQGRAAERHAQKVISLDSRRAQSRKALSQQEIADNQRTIASYAGLTGAVIASTTAAIQQGATAAQVAQAMAAAVLQGISQMAAGKAIEQTALALGSYPDFVGMGSHFASAALWAGLAVGAGVGSAAIAPDLSKGNAQAKAAAAGGPSYAGGGGYGGGGGGGGPVSFTVIVNAAGDVIDDGTYRRLGRVVSEASRRGYVKKAA